MNVIFRLTAQLVCAHFASLLHRLQRCYWAWACLGIFIPLTAWAQPAGRDPLNAQTTTPPITNQSAFSDYKPYQDPEWISWKTANDVVREFGSMAGMGGMGDMNGADSPDAQPGKGEQANQSAKPSHDMSNMNKSKTPASGSKKPASPASKPAEMNNMPGHDMSKMQGPKPKTNTPKIAPAPKTNDKGNMADMPGHDMGSMQRKTPSTPTTKSAPPSGKPAAPATMPGMSH